MSFTFPLEERNCYNCTNRGLCFLRRKVEEALNSGMGMLNINNPDTAPKGYQSVFESLAMACLRFEKVAQ